MQNERDTEEHIYYDYFKRFGDSIKELESK